jgi:phosphotransferase system enzyme I (PtsP)
MERLSPVFVRNPAAHERFKYFEGSGEERYSTFLGLPLIYHQKSLGVMVIQTIAEAAIDERDIPVFSVIASQIAATVAYSGLLEDLERQRDRADAPQMAPTAAGGTSPLTLEAKPLLRGVPVSAGFAEGRAHYLFESIGFDQIKLDVSGKPSVEAHRLEHAFETARREFQELARNIRDMPEQDAAIFEASLMLVRTWRWFDAEREIEALPGKASQPPGINRVFFF